MTRNRKTRLKPKMVSKRGRPAVPGKKIRAISRMLTRKADVQAIMRAVGLSKTTVERIRAEYNAVLCNTVHSLEEGDYLPDIEYRQALRRASGVKSEVYIAILQGIIDGALRAEDILDPPPTDPRLASAPQKVDPERKPEVVRGRRS